MGYTDKLNVGLKTERQEPKVVKLIKYDDVGQLKCQVLDA